jgi:hypothetical protein
MIVLCTYSLQASRAVDILDVARAHQCSTARCNGVWEFLETPELRQARQEIRRLNEALDPVETVRCRFAAVRVLGRRCDSID